MPKRGGLGRGLDALIPNRRNTGNGENQGGKKSGNSAKGGKESPETNEKEKSGKTEKSAKTSKGTASRTAGTSRKSSGSGAAGAVKSSDTNKKTKPLTSNESGISDEARRLADAILGEQETAGTGEKTGGENTGSKNTGSESAKADRKQELTTRKRTTKSVQSTNKTENNKPDEAHSPAAADEAESKTKNPTVKEQFPEDQTTATVKETSEEDAKEEAEGIPDGEAVPDKEDSVGIYAEKKPEAGTAENPDFNKEGEIVSIRISLVEPNRDQPRKYFDEDAIDELADSIRQFGIISPLLVQKKDDYYEIIAGERRWRAAKKAGLLEVPVIIREFSSQEAVEISLIENIQREDLNPIEEAKAYERLVFEYGLAQEEVAGRVSKSRSAVANSLRLLRLVPEVQSLVETGEISEGHARTLIPIIAADTQINIANQIVKERLSVRQTEKIVRDILRPARKPVRMRDEQREALLQNLSENLKAALGTKVSIRQNGKSRGRIEIEYYSDDELDRLYELLRAIR